MNDGSREVDIIGFCEVPPVVILIPPITLCTYVVAVDRNTFEISVPPDVKVFAATDVNDGVLDTATVGFWAVPPVKMLLPWPTDCTYVVAVERN